LWYTLGEKKESVKESRRVSPEGSPTPQEG